MPQAVKSRFCESSRRRSFLWRIEIQGQTFLFHAEFAWWHDYDDISATHFSPLFRRMYYETVPRAYWKAVMSCTWDLARWHYTRNCILSFTAAEYLLVWKHHERVNSTRSDCLEQFIRILLVSITLLRLLVHQTKKRINGFEPRLTHPKQSNGCTQSGSVYQKAFILWYTSPNHRYSEASKQTDWWAHLSDTYTIASRRRKGQAIASFIIQAYTVSVHLAYAYFPSPFEFSCHDRRRGKPSSIQHWVESFPVISPFQDAVHHPDLDLVCFFEFKDARYVRIVPVLMVEEHIVRLI